MVGVFRNYIVDYFETNALDQLLEVPEFLTLEEELSDYKWFYSNKKPVFFALLCPDPEGNFTSKEETRQRSVKTFENHHSKLIYQFSIFVGFA